MSKLSIHTFRAFRSRNYALFFCGQTVSQIGTWMQRTAVSWVIYSITHSALMLGVTVFAQQFPSFLLSLYGGVISDRYSRYKILLVTQTASMIQAVLLAALTLTKHYEVWEILSLSVVLGVINAFDVPARQPMVNEMINDKADLPNALALNSSMVNLARLLGPALSGLVLLKFGAGICFLLNALSFVAVLTSLLMMKLPPYKPSTGKSKTTTQLVEGFRYLKNTKSIGVLVLLLSSMSLLVLPFNTLLPVFAKVIFKGDAATFGYINSFIGLGALSGTFFLASLKPGTDLRKILPATSVVFGVGLLFFSRISYFPVAMAFAVISGFGMMSLTTLCLTIIQVNSDEKMRGRVMSFGATAYFGTLPLGSLLIGAVSQKIGSSTMIFCEGIIALVIAAIFSRFLIERKTNQGTIEPGEPEEPIAEEI
jgi:MFS family permease